MSGPGLRVQLEAVYLLHHHPWRDTSRILEVFSRAYGRVTLFARAARRGNSALPATLQPLGELLLSWSGRGEAGQLTGAERVRPPAFLVGDRLMSGFYVNELLIRLLPRHDSHPALFEAYATLVERLHDTCADPAGALRLFEKRLLEELGFGLDLAQDVPGGRPIEPQRAYRYRIDGGAEAVAGVAEGALAFSGASLLSLAREDLSDPQSLADARRLLRAALDQCLDARELRTREVMLAMRSHGEALAPIPQPPPGLRRPGVRHSLRIGRPGILGRWFRF